MGEDGRLLQALDVSPIHLPRSASSLPCFGAESGRSKADIRSDDSSVQAVTDQHFHPSTTECGSSNAGHPEIHAEFSTIATDASGVHMITVEQAPPDATGSRWCCL